MRSTLQIIKILLLLFLVLFIYHPPSCRAESFEHATKVTNPVNEAIFRLIKSRKLIEVDVNLDYDDGGANTKHDPPKKGKPGSGGKNP